MPTDASSPGGLLLARPVGIIHTPFKFADGTPIQPVYGTGALGEVVVDEEYEPALADIEGFERLWLVYWLDKAEWY